MSEQGKLKIGVFWLIFLVLLSAFGYWAYRFLSHQLYDLMLWQTLIEDIDHRLKPNEKDDINSDGIRSFREAGDFPAEDFNIIFSGDSYVYGHLLGSEQSTPSQFEKLARQQLPEKSINVANFGWSSSSPYLSLRLLQDKGAKYKPDLVIFVLDITDYKDDYFYKNVLHPQGFYQFMVDHPVLAHPVRQVARATDNTTGWQQALLGYPDFSIYFVAHQPYEESLPFFDNAYESLLLMNDFVTNTLEAEFVVFIPPRHWQYTDKESPLSWERHNYQALGEHVLNNFIYFDDKAKDAPFPIVSLLEDFKNTEVFPTTFERDSHWNPQGAEFAAEVMLGHCLRLDCFSSEGNGE